MSVLHIRWFQLLVVAIVVAATAFGAGLASAQVASEAKAATPEAGAFRVFLKDGTAVASVGELARVGDRVVFSLPLSGSRQPLASLAITDIDLARTDRYSEAVRAARYGSTRGEADFAVMSALVARTLSDITVTPGIGAQLALAERARRTLAVWPAEHYGYRADEVRQTLALLDEVVGGLRAAAGQTRFDVSLVAGTAPPPSTEALMAPVSLKDSIEQALRLAALAPSAAERVLLLEEASAAIAELPVAAADRSWRSAIKGRAASGLEMERRIDRRYGKLTAATLRALEKRAANSDVRGLVRVRTALLERDAVLGRKRPDQIQALLASIDVRLDAVRRLRLAHDRWKVREPLVRAYRDAITPPLEQLRRAQSILTDIRALAGPSLDRLTVFLRQLDRVAPFLRRLSVPDEARDAHAAAQSAIQLAETAARYRERAISSNDMKLAWDASAAAAGALLFLQRAEASAAALLEDPGGRD